MFSETLSGNNIKGLSENIIKGLSGRAVRSFEIQVAKATNGRQNCSAEESMRPPPDLTS